VQPRILEKSAEKVPKSPARITSSDKKLADELNECSFTPRINRNQISTPRKTSPRGFDETVQRMRIAN